MRYLLIAVALLLASCADKSPAPAVTSAPEPEVSVATIVAFTEGPAQGPDGMMYFTDVTNNRILRLNPQTRKHEVFRADSNRANGLLFDAEGRLIACEGSDTEHDNPRVTRTDLKTGKMEAIATQFEGKTFNGPNDVTIDCKRSFVLHRSCPRCHLPGARKASQRYRYAGCLSDRYHGRLRAC